MLKREVVKLANEENLIPLNKRTKSEQRKIQSKAGKKSGEVRREKKQLKDCMSTLLGLDIKDPQMLNTFEQMGIDDKSNKMLVTLGLFNAAVSGDVKAFKEIRNLIDEDNDKNLSELDAVLDMIEGNI